MSDDQAVVRFNPFLSTAVGDPWRDVEIPDVTSINEKTFNGIIRLLKQAPTSRGMGAVVLGEAGVGKTHLIKRLISARGLVFVYVHPLKDHHRVCASLLETVVTNLDGPPPGQPGGRKATQLDLMIANVLKSALVHYAQTHPGRGQKLLNIIKKDPLAVLRLTALDKWDTVLAEAKNFLKERGFPKGSTSADVMDTFFQYVDSSKRDAVRKFLSGYIPEDEDCELLGLRYRDGDLTVAAQEERSLTILKSIGKLLSYYSPMVLCFDQLENFITCDQVAGFGVLINDIVNQTENILPVAFSRAERWAGYLAEHLDHAAKSRLMMHKFDLEFPTLEQKIEIVRQRLLWAIVGDGLGVEALLTSCRPVLTGLLNRAGSPREVLEQIGGLLESIECPAGLEEVEKAICQGDIRPRDRVVQLAPAELMLATIKKYFEEDREKILSGEKKEPAKRETLIEALHLYFSNRGQAAPYRVVEVTEDQRIGLILRITPPDSGSTPLTLDFMVETNVNGKFLVGAFQRLTNRISDRTTTCSFFLRDSRAQIPTKPGGMPKTVVERDEFLKAGGALAYMEVAHLADLQALVYTSNAVGSGDISYTNESGERQEADQDMFNTFVRDGFTSDFISNLEKQFLTCPAACAPPPLRPAPPADHIEQILAILKAAPFKYKLESIAYALENKYQITLSHDELAVCIGNHAEEISQIPISPPIYYLRPKR
ncbi:MAG: hypothetical protein HQK56_03560 [Deltaproteobacteria bacterium]|nr:hypothetical protein [Deltaproteobacteria bacterium]